MTERNVTRLELRWLLSVQGDPLDSETITDMIDRGNLPPYDFDLSQRIRGWHASRLRDLGIYVPDEPLPQAVAGKTKGKK